MENKLPTLHPTALITARQYKMLRASIRRLAEKIDTFELAVETYVKRETGIDSFSSMSKEDASFVIDHVSYMEQQLKDLENVEQHAINEERK